MKDKKVLTEGNEGYETVVFLPPAGQSRYYWSPFLEELSDDFHTVAVELPGHYDHPTDKFDMEQAVDETVSIMDKYGPVVLVGYSLGGHVAAKAVKQVDSELVKGMVVMGATQDLSQTSYRVMGTVLKRGAPVLELAGKSEKFTEWFVNKFSESEKPDSQDPPEEIESDPIATTAGVWRTFSEIETREIIKEHSLPVHIIHGEEEMGLEDSQDLAEKQENAEITVLPGKDHSKLGFYEEETVDLMRDFASKCVE